jgi:hypothetical protein
MEKLKQWIDRMPILSGLSVYIDLIERHQAENPNVALDAAKSLLESLAKTILTDRGISFEHDSEVKFLVKEAVRTAKVMEIISQIDTSFLETSIAESQAYVDTNSLMIVHSLENKDTVLKERIVYKDKYITETRIVYKDSIQVKEIPVEVEVVKTVYPKTYWYLLGFFILVLIYIGIRIYLKFKV